MSARSCGPHHKDCATSARPYGLRLFCLSLARYLPWNSAIQPPNVKSHTIFRLSPVGLPFGISPRPFGPWLLITRLGISTLRPPYEPHFQNFGWLYTTVLAPIHVYASSLSAATMKEDLYRYTHGRSWPLLQFAVPPL